MLFIKYIESKSFLFEAGSWFSQTTYLKIPKKRVNVYNKKR